MGFRSSFAGRRSLLDKASSVCILKAVPSGVRPSGKPKGVGALGVVFILIVLVALACGWIKEKM